MENNYNNLVDIQKNAESGMDNEVESSFNLKAIYTMFILNWQWFVVSIVVFMSLAFIYLKYKSPIYQVSTKVLIKDDGNKQARGGNQMLANMQDLGFISNSNGIDNEVEIIRSHILAREAVKDLKLYTEYKLEGRIKDQLIYKQQPINVDLDTTSLNKMDDVNSQSERVLSIKMKISSENGKYNVKGTVFTNNSENNEKPFEASFSSLPAKIRTDGGILTFTPNLHKIPSAIRNRNLIVTITAPTYVAAGYIGTMSVEPTSKTTSIALISINDMNKLRAEDFLRQLVVCYNRQANADKNEIAIKTEQFINERLEKINAELGTTEGDLENYKKKNNLTQLKLDATETLTQSSQYSTKLAEAKSQIELLNYLREYIDDPDNKYDIIPSNIGLEDPASTTLIGKYNQFVLERNRLLQSASEIAPQVMTLTNTLNELQTSLRTALQQARRSADIKLQGIENQYKIYQNRIANTPEQERILTQIGRQQEVKSGLYLMLLQKREENSISLAATADKGTMIDDPIYGGKVSPKGSIILLGALVIGIGLPFGILYLLQLMRYKIEGHEDIVRLTKLPIVAEVAIASDKAKDAAGIVVHENKNDQIDEIFRLMRTNIKFMLKQDQKVIMFTSSTSGEGKTFNTANLAVSFALLGKKVILIGLDIRRPALAHLFNISDHSRGITTLLKNEKPTLEEIKEQILPSGINSKLDIMLAGPIPPNPTELLARESLGTIISHLKEAYDYIILDTAPVGIVTDTLQIGKYADVSVIVCRADYTAKSSLEVINDIAKSGKLHNMCIILNGIDMSKKKYSYYYGYGKYGKYGRYGRYGHYGNYGNFANSHYGNTDDYSIKR